MSRAESEASILGITPELVHAENEFYDVFIAPSADVSHNRSIYSNETRARFYRQHPAHLEFYTANPTHTIASNQITVTEIASRTYNMLPARHTNTPLTLKEVEEGRNAILDLRDDEGKVDPTSYLQFLQNNVPSYFHWLMNTAKRTGSVDMDVIVGSLLMVSQFRMRDENNRTRQLLNDIS